MKSKSLARLAPACLVAIGLSMPSIADAGSLPAGAEDLMITLVVDGTINHPVTGGGSPKFVELYARNAIPDLSAYALVRAGNGAARDPLTVDHVLPSVSLAAGEFFYAAGSSFQDYTIPFKEIYPDKDAVRNFGVNSNGNDATLLLLSPSGDFSNADEILVDTFGTEGVDGNGTPWFHQDGWGASKNGRLPSPTFDVTQWNVTEQTLDNLDAAGHAAALPAMVYSPIIPEPASVAMLLLGVTPWGTRRRR
jgi:hypothetical protein